MYTDSTLKAVQNTDQYVAPNGTQYPANYPKDQIPGLVAVMETAMPTDPTVKVTGYVIDNTHTQVWQTRAFTSDELAANARQRAQDASVVITASANSLLYRKAKKQAVVGNTASALKTLLKLQQGA